MPLKEISEPYLVINSASFSGTQSVTSSASNIKYKDSISYQVNFTTGLNGTVFINGSLDYNPGLPQSGGAFNAGNWTTITSQTVGSGTLNPILFNLNQLAMPWTQVQFTNTTASGTISCYFGAKSLG